MTHKDSHMFEKLMYEVIDKKGKVSYRIQECTQGDNVDKNRLVEGTNQRGNKRLQTKVCVLYKDEYDDLIEEIDALKGEVQHLKHDLNEKETKIQRLEKQIKEKESANIDKVSQVNETNANKILDLTNKHHDEVSNLKDEISQLKEDNSKLDAHYLDKMREQDKTHYKERETIRSYFIKLVTKANKEDNEKILELEKSIPSILKPFMKKHVNLLDEYKEKKLLNETEENIKSYVLSGQKEE